MSPDSSAPISARDHDGTTKRKPAIKLAQVEVRRTELCYITAVYRPTRTFFTQFCKFSNQELVHFNHAINSFCLSIMASRASSNPDLALPKKVGRGETYCAKFSEDGSWYRALVLSRDKEHKRCTVLFVDYGNVETLSFSDLIEVQVSDLPIMERAPFGIPCFLKDSESFGKEKADHLLDCLNQNYVMVKVLERQVGLQWLVEIPKHAYNIPFWHLFTPELKAKDAKESGQRKIEVSQTSDTQLTKATDG